MIAPSRRVPPPWTIDEMNGACFIVKDQNGQALAYVYFEEELGRRSAPNLLTRDVARRIAASATTGPRVARSARRDLSR